jgi:hypothetical protein
MMAAVRALRHMLWGDAGLGAFIGTLAMLILGVALLSMSGADVWAAIEGPRSLPCATWLENPLANRWVTLSDCHLDLSSAASRSWHGLGTARPDGGQTPRTLELFIPLSATDERERPPRAVVATTEAGLLGLVDELAQLPVEQVDPFIDAHRAEWLSKLKPDALTGYVEPIASLASRKALGLITREGAVVLEQNRAPRAANAVFGLLVGLVMVAGAALPLFRRVLLVRELKKLERSQSTTDVSQ